MEVLPQSMKLMALAAQDAGISVTGTVAEMLKLQQAGALVSDKVLPHFGKRMREAARANGGLDAALNSNRVAMNRFMFSVQEAANVVFTSGLSEGLTEFFNAAATSVVELKPLWQSLGTVFGSVFSILSKGIKAVTPTLKAFGEVLKSITTAMGESYAWILTTTTAAGVLFGVIQKVGGAKLFAMRTLPILGQITLLLSAIQEAAFWAEELDNLLFSRNKRGLLYDAATGKSNVAGGYATGMVNTITNSPTGWAWDMLTKSGLISSPTQLQNQLKLLQSGAVSVSEQQKVIVEITADAQQMGIGVAKSPAITSAMQGVVQQFAQ
jgi:hypothetical protein